MGDFLSFGLSMALSGFVCPLEGFSRDAKDASPCGWIAKPDGLAISTQVGKKG